MSLMQLCTFRVDAMREIYDNLSINAFWNVTSYWEAKIEKYNKL